MQLDDPKKMFSKVIEQTTKNNLIHNAKNLYTWENVVFDSGN